MNPSKSKFEPTKIYICTNRSKYTNISLFVPSWSSSHSFLSFSLCSSIPLSRSLSGKNEVSTFGFFLLTPPAVYRQRQKEENRERTAKTRNARTHAKRNCDDAVILQVSISIPGYLKRKKKVKQSQQQKVKRKRKPENGTSKTKKWDEKAKTKNGNSKEKNMTQGTPEIKSARKQTLFAL